MKYLIKFRDERSRHEFANAGRANSQIINEIDRVMFSDGSFAIERHKDDFWVESHGNRKNLGGTTYNMMITEHELKKWFVKVSSEDNVIATQVEKIMAEAKPKIVKGVRNSDRMIIMYNDGSKATLNDVKNMILRGNVLSFTLTRVDEVNPYVKTTAVTEGEIPTDKISEIFIEAKQTSLNCSLEFGEDGTLTGVSKWADVGQDIFNNLIPIAINK